MRSSCCTGSRSSSGSPRGQNDPKEAAPGFLALELDAAAVRRDRPARDGQTEPGAGFTGAAGFRAVEALEDPLAVRGRDSGPRVLHFDRGLSRRRALRANLNRAAVGRVLDRVVEEVDQAEPEDGRIAQGFHARAGLDAQA